LQAAFERLPANVQTALQQSAARVESYHQRQKMQSWHYTDEDGTLLGQQISALDRVGIYVPGGKAAYPSSVIMNAMPAHVAGVPEIIMVVPTPGGERNDIVLAAALWPASPACSPSAAHKLWPRWLMAPKPCRR
jgi:histidinol dehydrogenase